MQVVASGVTEVLDNLGFGADIRETNSDGTVEAAPQDTARDLLVKIHQGIADIQLKTANQEALHRSMLLAVQRVNGEVERLSQERQTLSMSFVDLLLDRTLWLILAVYQGSEVIASMLHQQRQEHEQLVQGLAASRLESLSPFYLFR